MVAISGRIIPAPLLTPATVMVLPADLSLCAIPLATGIGGRGALGRTQPVVVRCIRYRGIQARNNALAGRWLHDDAGGQQEHLLRPAHQTRWQAPGTRCRPGAGHPLRCRRRHCQVLTTIARMASPDAKWARHRCTGAARNRLAVNTPATAQPSSEREHRQDPPDPPCEYPLPVTPIRRGQLSAKERLPSRCVKMDWHVASQGEFSVAVFVLFSATAGARIIAAHPERTSAAAPERVAAVSEAAHPSRSRRFRSAV